MIILGDQVADSGGEGKSQRAEKYGTKKSKERREEPLGTMSYQTSSKRSPSFWLLIGARKLLCFSAELTPQFFCYSNSLKNITCPLDKLKAEFTSPIAKSTSPWLSDTTFFARWASFSIIVPINSRCSHVSSHWLRLIAIVHKCLR